MTACVLARADSLRPGQKFIGRDTWHLTILQVQRHGQRLEFLTVDGYGQEHVVRYRPGDMLDVFKH